MKRARLADGSAATTNRLMRAMKTFAVASSDASVLPSEIALEGEVVLQTVAKMTLSACKESIGSGTMHLTSRYDCVCFDTPCKLHAHSLVLQTNGMA